VEQFGEGVKTELEEEVKKTVLIGLSGIVLLDWIDNTQLRRTVLAEQLDDFVLAVLSDGVALHQQLLNNSLGDAC
jgi:hypothetical protein